MTVTIGPIIVTTLIAVLLAAAGAFIWFGKMGKRVDNLETNVNELKTDVRELWQSVQDVLILLYSHMGTTKPWGVPRAMPSRMNVRYRKGELFYDDR